jgi:hypothetical protein
MRFRSRSRLQGLALLACAGLAAFGVAASLELAITRATAHVASLTSEVAGLQTELRTAPALDAAGRDAEVQIARLHLGSSRGAQTVALIAQLERLAALHRLKIMSLTRQDVPSRSQIDPSTRLRHDVYLVGFDGTYPGALAAILDLAHVPLVTRVIALSFDRDDPRRPAGVRTTVQLAVFRIEPADAQAHAP